MPSVVSSATKMPWRVSAPSGKWMSVIISRWYAGIWRKFPPMPKSTTVQYRLLKAQTPAATRSFCKASREVPRRLQHPKRNTIGLRIPDHPVVLALLAELGEPSTQFYLILPGDEFPLNDAEEIRERLEHQVELVMDAGSCGIEMTTVIDLTTDVPELIRQGKGSLDTLWDRSWIILFKASPFMPYRLFLPSPCMKQRMVILPSILVTLLPLMEGRISLNPLEHIDLVGTILVPLTLFVLSKLTIGAGIFIWLGQTGAG